MKKRLKILVAEKSPSIQRMLRVVIVSEGHLPYIVSNIAEASKLFLTAKPDLVMLDVQMPFIDDLYTIKKMINFNDKVKVVLMSDNPEVTALNGVTNHIISSIVKPIELKEVIRIIREVEYSSIPKKRVCV